MNTIGSYPINSITSPSVPKDQLTQESFLKMLMTQLQKQDPLKPFDASTMMQQISQLTNLSATQKMADTINSLNASNGVSQVLSAAQIVGKNVEIATDKLNLTDSRKVDGAVVVPEGVHDVMVTIKDQSGKTVRTLKLNAPSSGVLDFTWDGLDEKGNSLEEGIYTVSATGTLTSGAEKKLATAGAYKVNSVALDNINGRVILNVDALGGVCMDDVVKIL